LSDLTSVDSGSGISRFMEKKDEGREEGWVCPVCCERHHNVYSEVAKILHVDGCLKKEGDGGREKRKREGVQTSMDFFVGKKERYS
jgi:hypothetical protein